MILTAGPCRNQVLLILYHFSDQQFNAGYLLWGISLTRQGRFNRLAHLQFISYVYSLETLKIRDNDSLQPDSC